MGTADLSLDATVERVRLDDRSWVDVARGWLPDAGEVYDAVAATAAWRRGRLWRYERWVEEPRLVAAGRRSGAELHPALLDAHCALQHRYGVLFDDFSFNWYQHGRESVAFHRDRELRWLENTVVAIVTLGARRPFFLRPRTSRYDHDAPNRGTTHDISPAGGDLLVMGGRCQADWDHSVPKVDHHVGGRISAQWRWTSRTGRPVQGPNYRAPRYFNRS